MRDSMQPNYTRRALTVAA